MERKGEKMKGGGRKKERKKDVLWALKGLPGEEG